MRYALADGHRRGEYTTLVCEAWHEECHWSNTRKMLEEMQKHRHRGTRVGDTKLLYGFCDVSCRYIEWLICFLWRSCTGRWRYHDIAAKSGWYNEFLSPRFSNLTTWMTWWIDMNRIRPNEFSQSGIHSNTGALPLYTILPVVLPRLCPKNCNTSSAQVYLPAFFPWKRVETSSWRFDKPAAARKPGPDFTC